MRITEAEKEAIVSETLDRDPSAVLYLFGSRAVASDPFVRSVLPGAIRLNGARVEKVESSR